MVLYSLVSGETSVGVDVRVKLDQLDDCVCSHPLNFNLSIVVTPEEHCLGFQS